MTSAQDLLRLAERCEAATGPDREIDRKIHIALFPTAKRESEALGFVTYGDTPHYSASLDAAAMLVPEGWGWSSYPKYISSLQEIVAFCLAPDRLLSDELDRCGNGATHALALTAACLRALAQGER